MKQAVAVHITQMCIFFLHTVQHLATLRFSHWTFIAPEEIN